jgi:hypothetical protein
VKLRPFALLLIASFASAEEEPVRHVVKAGESCSSIALKYWGDTRYVDLLHAANPELGKKPPPHVLREGMVLIIPPKPAPRTGPDAELTAVKNHVDVLAPDAKPAKANDPLFRGNRVSTEAESAADVTFRDETQVKLGERTLVVILGDAKSAAARIEEPSATLVTGALRAFMPKAQAQRGGSTTVSTDAARVKVFDGEAQVSADPKKTTRVAVYKGSSAIDARGQTRDVGRGFGSKAEIGQTPTPPRPLPPPPHWTMSPQLVLYDLGTVPSIVAEYATGPTDRRIAKWHVEIARDGIFRDVAVDTRVPAEIARLEAQPPGPGRYYIRVSAIDDDDFEGPFGLIARTLVVRVTTTAIPQARRRLEFDPPDAFCVRVGNVALERIEGPVLAADKEPVRIRCAPNESDPTTLLSLD